MLDPSNFRAPVSNQGYQKVARCMLRAYFVTLRQLPVSQLHVGQAESAHKL